jgi:soluble lytic murein transglycosylase-like protein
VASTSSSGNIPQLISDAAAQYGVDPDLAINVAVEESGLNQNAVSPAGAIGVFQLMPATAAGLGVNPYDLEQNIQGGVKYLSQMLAQFGDAAQALGAYNWGPGNVQKAVAAYGGDWLSHAPAETQNYVAAILGPQSQFAATFNPAPVIGSAASGIAQSFMQSASNWFSTLPPYAQAAIVAGGGYVAWLILNELMD